MEKKNLKMEKILNIILSIIIFLVIFLALYHPFTGLGIKPDEAGIEALVMDFAIITPVVLFLFGRTWKREIA